MAERLKISAEAMEDLFVTAEREELSLNAAVIVTKEMPVNTRVAPERARAMLIRQEG
jgi:hypothetical protein